jgi:predicted O-methyltransferase YrrM
MTHDQWAAVDEHFSGLVPPDPVLDQAIEDSVAAGLPQIQVSALQGKLLFVLARAVGARSILEIGTLGGYSTIWLGRALPSDGRLITLEVDPRHAEVATSNIARAGLAGVVELRLGRAVDTLPELRDEAPFDLVFIDADKEGYVDYLEWSIELSRPGTVIVADNVVRQGRVLDAETDDPVTVGTRRFNERLAAEPRVTATAIQTVGTKGYDGFAIAVVNDVPR